MVNPENVNFYAKVTGFEKVAESLCTPPGQTNHHGHPLNFPTMIKQAGQGHLLVASTNQQIKLFDIGANQMMELEKKHTKNITGLYSSATQLASCSADGTVQMYDPRTFAAHTTLQGG